jgi:dihydropteroate synthase
VPVITAISKRFKIPISIDTTKSEVAEKAIEAGASIINDISGLRFDERTADIAARHSTGLVLMHSRGDRETLHSQPPVNGVFADVANDFLRAIDTAHSYGVKPEQLALDIGIGFGKTQEQNLELIGKLDRLVSEFSEFPILVGASRKSFIGKILGDVPPSERLGGSIAAAFIAVRNGAKIVRVHDVKETVAALKIAAKLDSVLRD